MKSIEEKIERLQKKKNVRGLIKILQTIHYNEAQKALVSLGRLAFKRLAKVFQDEYYHNVEDVLSAMANQTSNRDLRNEILELAMKCTKHRNKYIRHRAVVLLQYIKLVNKDKEMRKKVFDVISDTLNRETANYPDIRGWVMQVIEKQFADLAGEEFLIKYLTDKNDSVRAHAGQSLDVLKWKPGFGELGATYYVARQYYEACEVIGFSATPALVRALQWYEIGDVLTTLGNIGDRRAIAPILDAINRNIQLDQLGLPDVLGIESAPLALAQIGGDDAHSALQALSIHTHIIPTAFDTAAKKAYEKIKKESLHDKVHFVVMFYSGNEPSPHSLLTLKKSVCEKYEKRYRMLAALDAKGRLPKSVDTFVIACLLLLKEKFDVPIPPEDAISYRTMETSDGDRIGIATFPSEEY
jgi:hypothetical protein